MADSFLLAISDRLVVLAIWIMGFSHASAPIYAAFKLLLHPELFLDLREIDRLKRRTADD